MNLQDLTIKELIESIDENISETNEVIKRLAIELNQEKDTNRRIIKKELIKKYDENIFRYKMQKLGIEEMIKEHALYAYRKTAQEGQVQEQLTPIKLNRNTLFNCLNNYDKEQGIVKAQVSIDENLLQEKLSRIQNVIKEESNSISDVIKIRY